MSRILLLLFSCMFFLFAGCSSDPYEGVDVEVLNLPSGVAAGVIDNYIVMKRGEERQIISISHLADGVRLMNCQDAPVFYAKMQFFKAKTVSVLRIELPPKDMKLNRYIFRELDFNKARCGGKPIKVLQLNSVSADGKTLDVDYEITGIYERKKGVLDAETLQIQEP